MNIKVIGTPIGVKPNGTPHDGDGDGFYTPVPGAPDKTPVPPKIALDNMMDRIKEQRAKHKQMKTRLDAHKALRTAYPQLLPFPEPRKELTDAQRDFTYGLLIAAEEYPFAKKLRELDLDGTVLETAPSLPSSAAGMAAFNENLEPLVVLSNKLGNMGDWTRGNPSNTVADEVWKRAEGREKQDQKTLRNVALVLHEMAHVQHKTKMVAHAGVDLQNPRDVMSKIMGKSEEEIEDFITTGQQLLREQGISFNRAKTAKYLIQVMGQDIFDQIEKDHMWDSLSDAEISRSIAAMGRVSQYGGEDPQEAVAEALSAQRLGIQWRNADTPNAVHDWIEGADVKAANAQKRDITSWIPMCTGYPTRITPPKT